MVKDGAMSAAQGEQRLRITELFYSLQGESDTVGWPTVFIRLTGCPLRCGYCDTSYAFQGGQWQSLSEIVDVVKSYRTRYVCVTGGEPLAQPDCAALLSRLCDLGYRVSLETSGAMDIAPVDTRVSRVMDIKTPGSGEQARNLWSNIEHLTPHDQVKFVVLDRADYEWAKDVLTTYELTARCPVLMSPGFGQLAPRQLADWVLEDQLDVRFQLQLHKVLWGDEPGR